MAFEPISVKSLGPSVRPASFVVCAAMAAFVGCAREVPPKTAQPPTTPSSGVGAALQQAVTAPAASAPADEVTADSLAPFVLADDVLRGGSALALLKAIDVRNSGEGEPASCDVDVLDAVGLLKGRALLADHAATPLVAGHLYIVALMGIATPQAAHSLALWKVVEVPADRAAQAFRANADRRRALTAK